MGTDVKHTTNKTVLQKHQAISKGTRSLPPLPKCWRGGAWRQRWVEELTRCGRRVEESDLYRIGYELLLEFGLPLK
jgi:hypothetical protein